MSSVFSESDINKVKQITLTKSQLIGTGSFGYVFKIEYGGKPYVLKVTLPDEDTPSDTNWENESQVLEKLSLNVQSSNYVPQYFGKYQDRGGRYCIIMEYVDGKPLLNVYREGLLKKDQLDFIFREIKKALESIHANGIAHNDVQLDNIIVLFKEDGKTISGIKLIDFGISGNIGEPDPSGEEGSMSTPETDWKSYEKLTSFLSERVTGGKRKTRRKRRLTRRR